MNKSILIIEPNVDGHYGDYLYEITFYFLKKGFKIYLAIDSGTEASTYLNERLLDILGRGKIEVLRIQMLDRRKKFSNFNVFLTQIKFWKIYKNIYNVITAKVKIDYVFIPYLDRVIYGLSIFRSPFGVTPLSGILMSLTFHHYAMGCSSEKLNLFNIELYKYLAFQRVLRLSIFDFLYTIDSTLELFSKNQASKFWGKVIYFPDPVEKLKLVNRNEAKKYFGISNEDPTLLIFGSMDARKNVLGAIDWINRMRINSLRVNLLIVGWQSTEVKGMIKNSGLANALLGDDSIFILDKFVSKEEEVYAFSAANFIWLRYINFYQMSGIMIKAGLLDLPMLLSDSGLIGWYKRQLTVSDIGPEFSLPRLRNQKNINPFAAHLWLNSLQKLNIIVDKLK